MPCSVLRILEQDNAWLRSRCVSAFRQGRSTYVFVEAETENRQRIREHKAEAIDCECQVNFGGT